jgi:hypothetical protein
MVLGCTPREKEKPVGGNGTKPHVHDHPDEGPHGGALAEWGNEEYHAEFTVDHKTKQATVYILDGTAKKAPDIDPAKITEVKLSITNVTPPFTLTLKHDPKKSDTKGIAFVGTHDALGKEMEFKGNISGKIGDKPQYNGDFKEEPHTHEK